MVPPVSSLGQGWENGPSLNRARYGLGAVQYNGHIYAAGGHKTPNTLEVLFSGETEWTQLAPLPAEQKFHCAALVEDKIYTLGSYGTSDICQIYDISENKCQAGPTLPMALYWATAQAVGNKIYLIGGWQPGGAGKLDTLWILDTVSGEWTRGASIPTPMQTPTSASYANDIFVFCKDSHYKYNIQSNRWTPFPTPPRSHGGQAAAVAAGGKIYLIGGCPGNINEAFNTTDIFDPVTSTWTTGPDLKIARYSFQAVYLDQEETIYAIAGRGLEAQSLGSVEKLSIETGTTFKRGNVNGDDRMNIADAIFILGYLYSGSQAPTCLDAADANDDGAVDIADAITLLDHLFGESGPLPEPFGACGIDPTADELGCDSYPPCE